MALLHLKSKYQAAVVTYLQHILSRVYMDGAGKQNLSTLHHQHSFTRLKTKQKYVDKVDIKWMTVVNIISVQKIFQDHLKNFRMQWILGYWCWLLLRFMFYCACWSRGFCKMQFIAIPAKLWPFMCTSYYLFFSRLLSQFQIKGLFFLKYTLEVSECFLNLLSPWKPSI